MRMRVKSAGSVWTPANIVTVVRVILCPIWLLFAELSVPGQDGWSLSAAFVALLYIFISLTDKLDGYLARSRGEVTTFGKFLDPIADKLAVTIALIYLLECGIVNVWVVLVVIAREFLVSGLRMVVASKGVVVAASNLGKWKTATTMASLCGLLVGRAMPVALYAGSWFEMVMVALLWISVILTAWSGVDYFVKCWPHVMDGSR